MGNQQTIKSHMQNAERTGVFTLSEKPITEFPKDIQRLQNNVRSLDLSVNKLKIIPDYIGSFQNLKYLNFNDNQLKAIPDSIGNLRKLETLLLANNVLTSLPMTLEGLVNLRTLTVSGNSLTSFPIQIVNLKHLEAIDLSKNKITEIPDNIESLQATEVNFNQNQLFRISESIASCPRLRVLRVEENCLPLSAIPKKLLTDSPVSLLAVEGNLFDSKDFHHTEGYQQYLERFTATKKKMM